MTSKFKNLSTELTTMAPSASPIMVAPNTSSLSSPTPAGILDSSASSTVVGSLSLTLQNIGSVYESLYNLTSPTPEQQPDVLQMKTRLEEILVRATQIVQKLQLDANGTATALSAELKLVYDIYVLVGWLVGRSVAIFIY